jgi:hypothetical protein
LHYSTKIVLSLETGEVLSKDYVAYDGPWALADRSAQGQAKNAANTAGSTAANAGNLASTDRSAILPGLEREANGGGGFSPQDLSNMTTAAGEGAGGANSGIVGTANLEAARTRNAGGFGAALDEGARDKTRALATANLGVQSKNADLKAKQQQFAQGEIGNMYGTDTSSMLKAMGLQTGDISAETDASKTGWLQNFTAILQALKPSGSAGGGGPASIGFGG